MKAAKFGLKFAGMKNLLYLCALLVMVLQPLREKDLESDRSKTQNQ